MRFEREIIYDWHDPYGFYPDEEENLWEEEYEDPWEREFIRSAAGGNYSPSNPWDAPGMSVSDFI